MSAGGRGPRRCFSPPPGRTMSRADRPGSGGWPLGVERPLRRQLARLPGRGGRAGFETVREINAFGIDGCFPDRTLLLALDEAAANAPAPATADGSDRIGGRRAYHREVDAGFRLRRGGARAGPRSSTRRARPRKLPSACLRRIVDLRP